MSSCQYCLLLHIVWWEIADDSVGSYSTNILRSGQNGPHFTDNSFKCVLLNQNFNILIQLSLNFPRIQLAIRRDRFNVHLCTKPLPEPMMMQFNDTIRRHWAKMGWNVPLSNVLCNKDMMEMGHNIWIDTTVIRWQLVFNVYATYHTNMFQIYIFSQIYMCFFSHDWSWISPWIKPVCYELDISLFVFSLHNCLCILRLSAIDCDVINRT